MHPPGVDDVIAWAAAFDPKRTMDESHLREAAHALFDELDRRGTSYLLVGGVALLAYVEGRNTQDIDLIVASDDADAGPWTVLERDTNFAKGDYRGLRVDLLLTANPLFATVRANHGTTMPFGDRAVPCATRHGLLLLKLYALPSLYRQGKLARAALYETDILMLHQGADVDDEALLSELAPHVAKHDLDELRRILDEQRTRRRAFGP